ISLLNYIDKRYDGGVPGCVCGNYVPGQMDEYMHIYTTVFDDVGGAEGIVHETGHQRLHCLGVDLETHTGLLLRNDPAERYVSPIRKDTLRPMSAVLQAQYSYVNVTQLDLKVYEVDPERGRSYLMINLPRIKEGFDEIHRNIKLTTEGQQWYDGFCRWTDRVIAAAEVD